MAEAFHVVRDGVVTALILDPMSAAERDRRLADLDALIRTFRAGEGDDLAIPGVPEPQRLRMRNDDGELGWLLGRRASIAAEPTDVGIFPAEVYSESEPGNPLAWPRAYRDGLLAETDHADLPGWRFGKDTDRLKAADAYRQALRDLPAASPNPSEVDFPSKPDGL